MSACAAVCRSVVARARTSGAAAQPRHRSRCAAAPVVSASGCPLSAAAPTPPASRRRAPAQLPGVCLGRAVHEHAHGPGRPDCVADVPAAAAAGPARPRRGDETSCWACGSCVNTWNAFCGSCDRVQPLDASANYFALLGVPESYDVSVPALDANFKALQRTVHPDRFGARPQGERDAAGAASSSINVAYRVLRNPSTRAQYLLRLRGVDVAGEATPAGAAAARAVDPTLLIEVVEAREALEDPEATAQSVGDVRAAAHASADACVAATSAAFRRGDTVVALRSTVALQYWARVVAEADEWLDARAEGRPREPHPAG